MNILIRIEAIVVINVCTLNLAKPHLHERYSCNTEYVPSTALEHFILSYNSIYHMYMCVLAHIDVFIRINVYLYAYMYIFVFAHIAASGIYFIVRFLCLWLDQAHSVLLH